MGLRFAEHLSEYRKIKWTKNENWRETGSTRGYEVQGFGFTLDLDLNTRYLLPRDVWDYTFFFGSRHKNNIISLCNREHVEQDLTEAYISRTVENEMDLPLKVKRSWGFEWVLENICR